MMPSLLKYFAVVGGILFAGLIGLNALLEPGGPGPTLIKADAPKAPAIRVDSSASKVERLRAEEAAAKAVAATPVMPVHAPTIAAAPAPADVQPVQNVQVAATQPAAVTTAPDVQEPAQVVSSASLTGVPTEEEAASAVRAAQAKMKAEKARKTKAKLARARAQQEANSRSQDQIYYGQRQQVAQPQSTYAYAPRPTFGPFGQGGGWGRGW